MCKTSIAARDVRKQREYGFTRSAVVSFRILAPHSLVVYFSERSCAMVVVFCVVVVLQLKNVDRVDVTRSHTDYVSGDAVAYNTSCCIDVEQRRRITEFFYRRWRLRLFRVAETDVNKVNAYIVSKIRRSLTSSIVFF